MNELKKLNHKTLIEVKIDKYLNNGRNNNFKKVREKRFMRL